MNREWPIYALIALSIILILDGCYPRSYDAGYAYTCEQWA